MSDDNKINRIGYRYLFDSKGCSLANRDESTINFNVSKKYMVKIYFGSKPKYGIDIVSNFSKYIIPGTTMPLGKFEFKKEINHSSKHGPFFLEIEVSITTSLMSSNNGNIRDLLLKQAEEKRDEFKSVINLVAGIIGLRFHRQFVLELINQNALAWEGDVDIRNRAGPPWEILESLKLNENGIKNLTLIMENLKILSVGEVEKFGLVFHWLLRAWHERDNLYTFIALFIPLECILYMSTDIKMSNEDKRRAESMRVLIKKHAGDQSEVLCSFLDKLITCLGPTLDERFVELAKQFKMKGWETDIEAFRKFKRMRNILLHGANKDVQQTVTIGDEEVRTLSDLVERYVNFFFFKDNKVYRSRWRPEIKNKDKEGNDKS
jgi:hypothetical protein